jgi:CRISPR-associated protein Cas1
MPALYLMEHGSALRHEHQRLIVEEDGQTLAEMPLAQVEEVVVCANASITTPTLKLLLYHGIDVVYLTEDGDFCGRLAGPNSGSGDLRRRQYAASLDPAFVMQVARACVAGKLRNMRALLMRYNRDLDNPAIAAAAQSIREAIDGLESVADLPSLLGVEGAASATYFAVLPALFKPPAAGGKHDWGFDGRNRRPPADPVNVLLSFGYTLLAKAVESAVLTVGLDAAIGFLHQPVAGRPALALDLMEEFRPIIADSTALRCLNAGLIQPAHFSAGENPDRPIVLAPEAAKIFIAEFEARLAIEFAHPASSERVTYRRAFELQARDLAGAVRGMGNGRYDPFVVR